MDVDNLFTAIAKSNLKRVQKCIDANVDLNKKNNWGDTPLTRAVDQGRLDIIKCLVKNGAHVNLCRDISCFPNEKTAIDTALLNCRADIVEFLLDHGAVVRSPNLICLAPKYKKRSAMKIRDLLKLQPVKLQHRHLLNTVIAMSPLQLPPYVLLWITDYNVEIDNLKECQKIAIIQRVFDRYTIKKDSQQEEKT